MEGPEEMNDVMHALVQIGPVLGAAIFTDAGSRFVATAQVSQIGVGEVGKNTGEGILEVVAELKNQVGQRQNHQRISYRAACNLAGETSISVHQESKRRPEQPECPTPGRNHWKGARTQVFHRDRQHLQRLRDFRLQASLFVHADLEVGQQDQLVTSFERRLKRLLMVVREGAAEVILAVRRRPCAKGCQKRREFGGFDRSNSGAGLQVPCKHEPDLGKNLQVADCDCLTGTLESIERTVNSADQAPERRFGVENSSAKARTPEGLYRMQNCPAGAQTVSQTIREILPPYGASGLA